MPSVSSTSSSLSSAGEAALRAEADEDSDLDASNEEEAAELHRRMVESAQRSSEAPSTAGSSEPQEVEAGRVVKRARVDARDPMSALTEEVRKCVCMMCV